MAFAAPLPAQPAPGTVFERASRERISVGRELPAYRRWQPEDARLTLETASDSLLVLAGRATGPVTLRLDGDGRIRSVRIDSEPSRLMAELRPTGEDSVRLVRLAFGSPYAGPARFPERRALWIARAAGPVPAANAPVTDTLEFAAARHGFSERVRIVRTRTLLGDTAIDGVTLAIVRDSARVGEEFVWPRRLLPDARDEILRRTVAGVLTGIALVDRSTGIARVVNDTTHLDGVLATTWPDARTFATVARIDRVGTMTAHDPGAWARLTAERRERRERESGGMIMVPDSAERARLAEARALPPDSTVQRWLRASDAAGRDSVARILAQLEAEDHASHEWTVRMRDAALAAGDTLAALQLYLDHFAPTRHLDTATWRLLRPWLADPAAAHAAGLLTLRFYDSFLTTLLHDPPALDPNGRTGACTPDACRMIAQERSAADPRLNDLGLVMELLLSARPALADTVAARAGRGSGVARMALPLIHGIGSTWPAGSHLPAPAAGAGWREWFAWTGTVPDPRFAAPAAAGVTEPTPIRFDGGHATALRFHARLTGRDFVAEMRRAYAAAAEDSARLVYGAIRLGLEGAFSPPDSIAARVLSTDPAMRALGLREMAVFIARAGEPADSATRAAALNGMLAMLLVGARPWPFRPDSAGSRWIGAGDQGALPLHILSDSVPADVLERWTSRATPISAAAWREWPPRRGARILLPQAVLGAGPFVVVGIDYVTWESRAPDEAPRGYAGGNRLYLLRTPDGWVIVDVGAWAT